MLECDGPSCGEKFHKECVKLDGVHFGPWYCSEDCEDRKRALSARSRAQALAHLRCLHCTGAHEIVQTAHNSRAERSKVAASHMILAACWLPYVTWQGSSVIQ